MEKNIKDYLHFHLGCEIRHDKGIYVGTLTSIGFHTAEIFCDYLKRNEGHRVPPGKDFGYFSILIERLKPVLRPLSDMTEEESIEIAKIHKYDVPDDDGVMEEIVSIYGNGGGILMLGAYLPVSHYLEGLLWLLKNHFDLFGLIESGLAIDKTKQLAK